MRRLRPLCLAPLLLACVTAAAPPTAPTGPVKISGELKVPPYRLVELAADGAGAEDLIFWDVTPPESADVRENGAKLLFVAPPGEYRVTVRVVPVKDGKISGPARTERCVVVIGMPPPPKPTVSVTLNPPAATVAPGGIVRFVPTVTGAADMSVVWTCTCVGGGNVQQDGTFTAGSVETTATVTVTSRADPTASFTATVLVKGTPMPPAPIPEPGLRVLIVYETADAGKMPPAQQNILYGQQTRDYLNQKCVVGPDGKTKEWRIWDKDVATGSESQLWQTAMKRPRASTPWLIVSNGTTGFEGPLPATVDDFLNLIKKYAGG